MQNAMKIRKAEPQELQNVRLFYHSLIDAADAIPLFYEDTEAGWNLNYTSMRSVGEI